jgi:hypothetical protein
MATSLNAGLGQSRVTAVLDDSALSSILAKGAKLGDFQIDSIISIGDTAQRQSQ